MTTESGDHDEVEGALFKLGQRLIQSGRVGYHAYECEGEGVVYCLYVGAVLRIPLPVAWILVFVEQHCAEWDLGASGAWPLEPGTGSVLETLSYIKRMADAGYLEVRGLDVPDGDKIATELARGGARKMMLLVNSGCNMACGYCYERAAGVHDTGSEMSFEMAMKSVRRLVDLSGGVRRLGVTFFGGEPLLSFRLTKRVVQEIRRKEPSWGKQFSFTITTNGTLLTDDVIDFLVKEAFAVMLGLDGPPEKNDRWRVLRGAWVRESASWTGPECLWRNKGRPMLALLVSERR